MAVNAATWGMGFLWGVLLGLFYFGGLWMTLSALPRKKRPKRWLAVSYVVRLAGAMAGFWVVVHKDLLAFFFTLAAFFLVRIVLIRRLAPKNEKKEHATEP